MTILKEFSNFTEKGELAFDVVTLEHSLGPALNCIKIAANSINGWHTAAIYIVVTIEQDPEHLIDLVGKIVKFSSP